VVILRPDLGSDAKPKRRKKRQYDTRPEHGLYAKNYAKPVAWKIDYDYLDKLSPEMRAWLSDFSDAHYSGDFRSQHGSTWFPHERREAYVAKNAANRDSYAIAAVSNRVSHIPDLERATPSGKPREFDVAAPSPPDTRPVPEYLNSETYRAALEEYRASLPPRGLSAKGFPTEAERVRYERARAQLQRIVRYGETFGEDPEPQPRRDEPGRGR